MKTFMSFLFSIFYLVVLLTIDLVCRKVAYYSQFTGTSVLKLLHSHSIMLGTVMFVILSALVNKYGTLNFLVQYWSIIDFCLQQHLHSSHGIAWASGS